jgi:hypothetical protein
MALPELSPEPTIANPAAATLVGAMGTRLLTSVWGGGESEITMIKHYGFTQYLLSYGYLPLVVLSALGAGWIFLLDPEVRALAPARALSWLPAITTVVMPLLVLDTSRMIAGILWSPDVGHGADRRPHADAAPLPLTVHDATGPRSRHFPPALGPWER